MITNNTKKVELVQKLIDEKKISAVEAAILLEEQEGNSNINPVLAIPYPYQYPFPYPYQYPFQWQDFKTTCLTTSN